MNDCSPRSAFVQPCIVVIRKLKIWRQKKSKRVSSCWDQIMIQLEILPTFQDGRFPAFGLPEDLGQAQCIWRHSSVLHLWRMYGNRTRTKTLTGFLAFFKAILSARICSSMLCEMTRAACSCLSRSARCSGVSFFGGCRSKAMGSGVVDESCKGIRDMYFKLGRKREGMV